MKINQVNGAKPNGLKYEPKDFKSAGPVKWCPGCGDHAILNSLHKAMAELGVAPHETVVVSGIGCSSRLTYYMNTYGMHTIHGRGSSIATGVKVSNPNLSVWSVSGDGDALAIGGNHFIHAIRRNVDLNIILMNNKIYGLTKGQYSPTSDRGFVSKSSPFGTVEDPFIPAELVLGARGNFFARTIDVELALTKDCLLSAAKHRGAAVVEALVNCVIFNNGIHKQYSDKEVRDDMTIVLKQGEPMIYGKDRNKGLVLEGFELKSVTIGENGVKLEDILVHDATTQNHVLHSLLAMMHTQPGMPIALGVIRDVEAPAYDFEVSQQLIEVQERNPDQDIQKHLNHLTRWVVE
ncbi:2-oxoacid:ferredoxin oxidoreductase subunit beta [Porphyromonas levii]|uniref:2-oxoacid:ferredoxin oxidoreductase subunit beta n=1 Tax=Porphyromonas levii TaxID=28114 RepID=UPI001B8D723F|nr:2-oxoacid:ferredoxin oxidoreductase subunit beta [Porphyromonas levii]MBR8732089.1 2-oxoglutarate oxidoreductase subunit KorB [Porphyromonas levii]MBR8770117.1 2-oxoglutarate oxidoreductase subunit KorB [Porphyromonas levii]